MALHLGVNRVGRSPDNEFQLEHSTISTHHCEFIVSVDGIVLHDCHSTNGTFVNDQPVREVWLEARQVVRLGSVELLVESTEVNIAIPVIERTVAPPPEALPAGGIVCPRHPQYLATFDCPHCRELMCSGCVRIIRIKGGKPHYLCIKCHNPCERIEVEQQSVKKKGFLGFLQDTVRLKFGGRPRV